MTPIELKEYIGYEVELKECEQEEELDDEALAALEKKSRQKDQQ